MSISYIPQYPLFSPINMEMREELDCLLSALPDGISEFTFLNLYLFQKTYDYTISKHKETIIIKASYKGEHFFIIPTGTLEAEIVHKELNEGLKWSHISQSFLEENQTILSKIFPSLTIEEDRDNFDYIYLREHLVKLEGKELHKKKTHINKFEKTYTNIAIKELTKENIHEAFQILEEWKEGREDIADYEEAKQALNLINNDNFELKSIILYVENQAIAWTLAEILKDKKTAVVLFEKALSTYKGSFQYINYAFVSFLDEEIEYINREQDLGDEGLRQAKMTYRPIKFIKKYKAYSKE
ncbi:MAG: DUF2156 domain-containing protein [Treponema sp.]